MLASLPGVLYLEKCPGEVGQGPAKYFVMLRATFGALKAT